MKLTKDTLAVLKNFSGINNNLILKAGNKISTVSSGRNIVAEAVVDESFDVEFGIYDLNEFLGAVSLFDSPDMEFSDKSVTLTEGGRRIKYFAAAPSTLTPVPTIKAFPTPDITFELKSATITQIMRAASVLRATDFSVVGDGETIRIVVADKSNPTSNVYDTDVELGDTDKKFKVNFKVENIKMMSGDYRVSIGGKKVGKFQSTSQHLMYYVAVELDSTFEF